MEIGDQHWCFSHTDHPVETLAPRGDSGGRSFAFSADTASGRPFDQLGDGIHLALCEATFLEVDRPQGASHLTGREAGAMAAACGVERLLPRPGRPRPPTGRAMAAACGVERLLPRPGRPRPPTGRAMAAACGVERLLLTHLVPGSDADAMVREASESFGRPVDVVECDGRCEV